MAYTSINPYVPLLELIDELKIKPADVVSGSAFEDELKRSIDDASRWVDEYTGKDYFYHDHTVTPITFDQFSKEIYNAELYLPFTPVISITEVKRATVVLNSATEYRVNGERLLSLIGSWNAKFPDNLLTVKGRFGYSQSAINPVTEAGDTGSQLQNWSLSGLNGATLYWKLEDIGGGLARVRLYLESTFTNLVSQGTGANTGTVIVTLAAQNNSGISGTVEMSYASDDTDAANSLTPLEPAVNMSEVPQGIPQKIKRAVRLVAAALSGHNRKEIVDITGARQSVLTMEIPKTVYDMLGARARALTL